MGQAVYKIRGGAANAAPASAPAPAPARAVGINTQNVSRATVHHEDLSDTLSSLSSSPWVTDPPSRSSSTFSAPTGYSSLVSTDKSKVVSLNGLQGTESQQKSRESDESEGSAASSPAPSTSLDHPPMPHIDIEEDGFIRATAEDQKWQDAVNVFLKFDPIAKTPKERTRSEYKIRRNYCYIKSDTGLRWKNAVEKYRARQYYPSIPIPNSEWSEA